MHQSVRQSAQLCRSHIVSKLVEANATQQPASSLCHGYTTAKLGQVARNCFRGGQSPTGEPNARKPQRKNWSHSSCPGTPPPPPFSLDLADPASSERPFSESTAGLTSQLFVQGKVLKTSPAAPGFSAKTVEDVEMAPWEHRVRQRPAPRCSAGAVPAIPAAHGRSIVVAMRNELRTPRALVVLLLPWPWLSSGPVVWCGASLQPGPR